MQNPQAAPVSTKKQKKDIAFEMDAEDFALGRDDDVELGDVWTSASARQSTMESTGEAAATKVRLMSTVAARSLVRSNSERRQNHRSSPECTACHDLPCAWAEPAVVAMPLRWLTV